MNTKISLWQETISTDPFCAEVHALREKMALMLSNTPSDYLIAQSLKTAIDGLDMYTGYSSTSDYVEPFAKGG